MRVLRNADCRMRIEGGYSLVEVLVSLAIFSIASLGLSIAVTNTLRSGTLSEHFTVATILAQDKLEVLSAPGVALSDGNDSPQSGFDRSWVITPDSPEAGVHRIEVTVTWTDDRPHTVMLATVMNE
jgi:prepilin-type N-terminal cleavage/methylation domain-containing protein